MKTDNEIAQDPIVKTVQDRTSPARHQSAMIYDLLSEGEIHGLDNGMASVFLDGTRLIDEGNWNTYKPKRTASGITCTGGSDTITVPNDFGSLYHSTTDGTRYIRIQKAHATLAGNGSSTGASGTAHTKTITTTSSFFTSAMVASSNMKNGLAPLIRIPGLGPHGVEYVGEVTRVVSGTEAEVHPAISTTGTHKTISCDYIGKVDGYASGQVTVESAPSVSVSSAAGQISTPGITTETFNDYLNFKNVHLNFRSGNRHQLPSPRYGETQTPSASFAITPNEAIKQNNRWSSLSNIPSNYNDSELTSDYDPSEGQANDTIITATGSGTKALGLVEPGDIDNIKVIIQFPQGLNAQKIKTDSAGEKAEGHAEFQMFFEYTRDNSNYETVQVVGPTDNEINTRGLTDSALLTNTGMEETHHAWGPVNFNTANYLTPNNGYIVTYSKSAFFDEFIIPIDKYKPFNNWRVRIRKVTADNPLAQSGDWQYTNSSVLYAVEAQVHDWLSYPNSAYASLAVNATDFNSTALPARQYEIKGIKCQVPTNYNARYELSSTANASYTRNISSGANESTYQNWDGTFRGDTSVYNRSSVNYNKVWTDNPAWVFYDLMTNKRYGLGFNIDPSQIDKYELYQIAQYCDELVPDGKGGEEPRFSANVYLSNSQQAFKVMKDFASMFRGILFWHNGKLTATADRDKEPVYTFTKGNIIDGAFSYEGTSKKLRTNQVKVTWNDPDQMYRQNVAVVEDTPDIVDRGRIVTKSVLAYGCTSEGQAMRYGKWNMLSEKLQKEIVKFTTGLNGNFLKPGDVIQVQDADRGRVQFSGRVSNTGTRNTTNVPLDRTITLAANTNYYLTIISSEPGCYLTDTTEDSYTGQTIQGHANNLDNLSGGGGYTNGTYTNIPTTGGSGFDLTVDVTVSGNAVTNVSVNNKGFGYGDNEDITVTNYGGFTTSGTKATFKINGVTSTSGLKHGDLLSFVITQEGASNLRNGSNVRLVTAFSPDSRVERKPVTTSAGSVSSLVVSPAFTSAPDASSIWALTAASTTSGDSALDTTGSAKKYQIASIQEDTDKQTFAIAALEYVDDKFTEVDRGWKYNVPTYTDLKFGDAVPAVTGVAVEISPVTAGNRPVTTSTYIPDSISSNKATISWISPTTSRTDSDGNAVNSEYEYIESYEVEHTFTQSKTSTNLYEVAVVRGGTSFEVPNINLGTYRVRVRVKNILGNYSPWVAVEGGTGTNLPSHPGARTYLLPTGGDLSTTLSISGSTVSLGAGATQTYRFVNPIGNALTVSSASAAKGTQDFNGMGASATAYLVVDHSVPDLKAIELAIDTTSLSAAGGTKQRFTYWKEVGASNNGLTAATGTVSMTVGTTTVTGSSTNFDGEFQVGDFIKIGSGTSYNATSDYFRVTKITSDTQMTVDAAAGRTYSGATAAYQTFRPDYNFDTVIAKVTTDSSTNYTLTTLCGYNAEEIQANDLASGILQHTVRLTADKYVIPYDIDGGESTTLNFTAAAQGVLGTATFKFDVDGTTKQAASTTATYTMADSDEPASGAAKTVKVTLFDDGVEKATDSVSVFGIQDGEDAITVIVTNETHALPTTSGGTVTYTNSGTDIRVFKGSTPLAYGTGNNQFTVAASATNITAGAASTVSTYTRRFANASSCTAQTASIEFTVTVKNSLGTSASFTKIQTFTKATDGADGSPGAAGAAGKVVQLSAADYSIVYNAAGSSPSPSSTILLSASASNFTNPFFKFTGDGITDETSFTDGASAVHDTFTFNVPSSHFSTPKTLRVGVSDGDQTEVAFDTISIFAVKPGSDGATGSTGAQGATGATGAAGVDGMSFVLSNSAHVFPASNAGVVSSYAGSGTTIEVFEGATNVVYDNQGTSANTFKIQITTDTNITGNTSFTDSGNFVTVGNHSAMSNSSDTALIIYTVSGKRADGTAFSTTLQQSFSKSKIGSQGVQGNQGDQGDQGDQGPQGAQGAAGNDGITVENTQPYILYLSGDGGDTFLPNNTKSSTVTFKQGSTTLAATTITATITSTGGSAGNIALTSGSTSGSPTITLNPNNAALVKATIVKGNTTATVIAEATNMGDLGK